MQNDIGLFVVDTDACIDLLIDQVGVRGDAGLETAILISLFTDRRVEQDELPIGHTDRRGWWGDMFPDVDGDQIGSKLWLLGREKVTNETLEKYRLACIEALQWMLIDGVATNVEVETEYTDVDAMRITIYVTRPNRERTRFSVLWDGQAVKGDSNAA